MSIMQECCKIDNSGANNNKLFVENKTYNNAMARLYSVCNLGLAENVELRLLQKNIFKYSCLIKTLSKGFS